MKKHLFAILIVLLSIVFIPTAFASQDKDIKAKWITADDIAVNDTNTWIAFRKDINLKKVPKKAISQIAADSKYWLWINGDLVIFEGGLKRGPTPTDTYYDEIDLAPYLRKGENKIAVLLWYFGKPGFSHNDSGKSGLLFNMNLDHDTVISDSSWLSRRHPAYSTASGKLPNKRLSESNIRYNALLDNATNWTVEKPDHQYYDLKPSKEIGHWGAAPWNKLIKRPIPFWKDHGIKSVDKIETKKDGDTITHIGYLPSNLQITPIINVTDSDGNHLIDILTDHTYGGSDTNLRAQYITKKGDQEYESLGWLNGEKIILKAHKDVKINDIKYRETGYDAAPDGRFSCDNEFYSRFWNKALRTLYVNMRDSYFDCPDRERAQWWGDVVVLMGQSFYTYSPSANQLMKKAIYELVDWQDADGTLNAPIPQGNYKRELPAQILASIGEYGFWNYYMNTGDKETIEHVYPAVKNYLTLWSLDDEGLTNFRSGSWSWGDWGNNIDIRLILAGWHYMALQSAAQMADLLDKPQEASEYRSLMSKVKEGYNKCWNGYAYRHPSYQKETDDRVQALAVLSGIAEKDKYEPIYDVFKTQWHASPYMEKYVMEALFVMGKGDYALERVEKRFAKMVNSTEHSTLFEGWDVGGYGGGTTNHAWSGGAVTVISKYLCGISPLEAGYRVFKIEPAPTLFNQASISVPSVAGEIKSAYIVDDASFTLNVSIPKNTTGIVYLPVGNIDVYGKTIDDKQYKADSKYASSEKRAIQLKSGDYTITTSKF